VLIPYDAQDSSYSTELPSPNITGVTAKNQPYRSLTNKGRGGNEYSLKPRPQVSKLEARRKAGRGRTWGPRLHTQTHLALWPEGNTQLLPGRPWLQDLYINYRSNFCLPAWPWKIGPRVPRSFPTATKASTCLTPSPWKRHKLPTCQVSGTVSLHRLICLSATMVGLAALPDSVKSSPHHIPGVPS
jgi:hypothetical protein